MKGVTIIQILTLLAQFYFLFRAVVVTRKDLKIHKNILLKKYKELPEGYLQWLLYRDDVTEDIKNNIREVLKEIECAE